MTGDQYDPKGPFAPTVTTMTGADLARQHAPDTVYAHVERTVHALLDQIVTAIPSVGATSQSAERIKLLAEAVQALSAWPQFNPMNAREQYKQLAEYEVKRAIEEQGIRISGGATEAERTDVGSAFEMAFSKIATLADRVEKLEGTF